MDDENFMESFKSKDVLYYLKSHIRDLEDLKQWCKSQDTKGELFVNYYPNHSKILIFDYFFAINGSFNWLSNSGGAKNEERSWVVYDKKFIESDFNVTWLDKEKII